MPQYANNFLGGSFKPGVTPQWAQNYGQPMPSVLTTFIESFSTTPALLLTPDQYKPLQPLTGGNPFFHLAVTNNAAAGGPNLLLNCPLLSISPTAMGNDKVTIPPGQTAYWAATVSLTDTSLLTWGTLMAVLILPTYGAGYGIFAAASAGTVAATIVIG